MNENKQPDIFSRFLISFAHRIKQDKPALLLTTGTARAVDDDSPEPATLAIALERIRRYARPAHFG